MLEQHTQNITFISRFKYSVITNILIMCITLFLLSIIIKTIIINYISSDWNNLDKHLRKIVSPETFKRELKTHL